MPKFRKKPVEIEAIQFLEGFFKSAPKRFREAVCREHHYGMIDPARPHIHTLEGPHYVIVGDWIIEGVIGEFYPCKNNVFDLTYGPSERAVNQREK